MEKSFNKLLRGYESFRKKYAEHDNSIMSQLEEDGQKPAIMVLACCDSRVDPAVILQCDPGDFFTIRNVANLVPPCEADEGHHGTSAAMEYGICYLNVKHFIILGHSSCGGIQALASDEPLAQDDFISRWVSLSGADLSDKSDANMVARKSLLASYQHCLSFPWLKQRVDEKKLKIHLWYFDIKHAELSAYSFENGAYEPLINFTRNTDEVK